MKRSFVFVVLFVFSCKPEPLAPPENRAPLILSIEKNTNIISARSYVELACDATDRDGDSLVYNWISNFGSFSNQSGNRARWNTVQLENGLYTITAIVTDPEGAGDTATTEIEIATRIILNNRDENIGQGCGTSFIAFNDMPSQSRVRSMTLSYLIFHPNPAELKVSLDNTNFSDDNFFLFFDHESGHGNTIQGHITDINYFQGSAANGTWSLRACDDTPGNSGFIDWWELTIYYTVQ